MAPRGVPLVCVYWWSVCVGVDVVSGHSSEWPQLGRHVFHSTLPVLPATDYPPPRRRAHSSLTRVPKRPVLGESYWRPGTWTSVLCPERRGGVRHVRRPSQQSQESQNHLFRRCWHDLGVDRLVRPPQYHGSHDVDRELFVPALASAASTYRSLLDCKPTKTCPQYCGLSSSPV
jgi:hypothetical protein